MSLHDVVKEYVDQLRKRGATVTQLARAMHTNRTQVYTQLKVGRIMSKHLDGIAREFYGASISTVLDNMQRMAYDLERGLDPNETHFEPFAQPAARETISPRLAKPLANEVAKNGRTATRRAKPQRRNNVTEKLRSPSPDKPEHPMPSPAGPAHPRIPK